MEILNLTNTEYEGKTIRVCTLPDGRKAASIHDVMSIATGIKNFKDTYMDLKKRFPEISDVSGNSDHFQQHKFSGQGQRVTPVATAKGIMKIMLLLPGSKAAAFRNKAAEVLVRFLGGDESLIEEIRANGAIAQSNPNSIQAFVSTETSRDSAITKDDYRRKYNAETQRLELENREFELRLLNMSRSYLEQIEDPRLVQTLTDSINNQLSTVISGGNQLLIQASSEPTVKTIDEILMNRAANYSSIKTDLKAKIGKAIVVLKGRDGLEKVKKYINGEQRYCNAYPVEWEEEILTIAEAQGVVLN